MTKKKKRNEQPQEKQHNGKAHGEGVWPIIYKWKLPLLVVVLRIQENLTEEPLARPNLKEGTA